MSKSKGGVFVKWEDKEGNTRYGMVAYGGVTKEGKVQVTEVESLTNPNPKPKLPKLLVEASKLTVMGYYK